MSTRAARRARLLRLRAVEHRLAVAKLAMADAAYVAVTDVADRVAGLRDAIVATKGSTCGLALQNLAELSLRLDRAHTGLQPSLGIALQARIASQTGRQNAHLAEERTRRVHHDAVRREAAERENRIATALPPRPRKTGASQ